MSWEKGVEAVYQKWGNPWDLTRQHIELLCGAFIAEQPTLAICTNHGHPLRGGKCWVGSSWFEDCNPTTAHIVISQEEARPLPGTGSTTP